MNSVRSRHLRHLLLWCPLPCPRMMEDRIARGARMGQVTDSRGASEGPALI